MTICQVDAACSTFTLLECPECGSDEVSCYPPAHDPTSHHELPSVHLHECETCGFTGDATYDCED